MRGTCAVTETGVSSIQPVPLVLLFRYVLGGSIHTPGKSYVEILVTTTPRSAPS